jgi:hypothetical protein
VAQVNVKMNTMARRAALLAAMLLWASAGWAQERHERHEPRRQPPPAYASPHWQFDSRYRHDHYYPRIGFVAPALPGGAISIGFGGGHYFFHGGVWFRPSGSRFVVIAPPIGIVVPLLPPSYATLWIGGAPYYYANGVYYVPASADGYRVVAPPAQAEQAQPVPPAPAPNALPEPIYYPRSGQSAEQTEADRQECNRWATTQPRAMADASVFQRAVAACMEGRGYTVR